MTEMGMVKKTLLLASSHPEKFASTQILEPIIIQYLVIISLSRQMALISPYLLADARVHQS